MFLGMLNFYRGFYLSGPKTDNFRMIMWAPGAIKTFDTTKQHLLKTTLLAFSQRDALLAVFADASGIALGEPNPVNGITALTIVKH